MVSTENCCWVKLVSDKCLEKKWNFLKKAEVAIGGVL